jgi:phage FluMu gp28-like protein
MAPSSQELEPPQNPGRFKIWAALFPVISAGWKLRVVSTPNGKGNKFYELMTDAGLDGTWSRHTVDIYQAVADGLPRDIAELKGGLNDEDAWAQEYELQWLDEASAWISYELIDGCESDQCVLGPLSASTEREQSKTRETLSGLGFTAATMQPRYVPLQVVGASPTHQGGACFVGVDIAARNDLFVIWVIEAVGDVYWTREIIARRRISFAEQDALLDDVFDRYRIVRCCMDQTGLGEKPVEDAQRRHGSSRVEGVIFTGPNKMILATHGKQAFEDRKIRIPMGDRDLRQDLHKLQKVTGPTGAPRFIAESDAGGHADRAWACFLALNAAAGRQVGDAYATVNFPWR